MTRVWLRARYTTSIRRSLNSRWGLIWSTVYDWQERAGWKLVLAAGRRRYTLRRTGVR